MPYKYEANGACKSMLVLAKASEVTCTYKCLFSTSLIPTVLIIIWELNKFLACVQQLCGLMGGPYYTSSNLSSLHKLDTPFLVYGQLHLMMHAV